MYLRTQIVSYNGDLFKVKRTFKVENVKFDPQLYCRYIHCDKVAKKGEYYFFLEQILEPTEVEYIENKTDEQGTNQTTEIIPIREQNNNPGGEILNQDNESINT
jgi:hypothetical protein